jgi:hypothetical protein
MTFLSGTLSAAPSRRAVDVPDCDRRAAQARDRAAAIRRKFEARREVTAVAALSRTDGGVSATIH